MVVAALAEGRGGGGGGNGGGGGGGCDGREDETTGAVVSFPESFGIKQAGVLSSVVVASLIVTFGCSNLLAMSF